jgi:hypothetical protein
MMHLMVMVVKHTVKPPCKTTHLDGQPWAPPASRSVNSVLGQRHRELDRRGRLAILGLKAKQRIFLAPGKSSDGLD